MAIRSGNGIRIVESPSDKWSVQEDTPFVLHNPGEEFDDIFVFLPPRFYRHGKVQGMFIQQDM